MDDEFVQYDEEQSCCPDCKAVEGLTRGQEESCDGGGNFSGYFTLCWCPACEHEWGEAYEFDM